MQKARGVRTPAEAKAWFERHGVPVSEWARTHGFDPAVVFSLLNGRTRGHRGMAHQAAIALGLKDRPATDETSPLDPDGQLGRSNSGGRESAGRTPANMK